MKKISFPKEEWDELKKDLAAGRICSSTRVSKEYGKFNQGDEVVAPWGDKLKIVSSRFYIKYERHAHWNKLTAKQKKEIEENAVGKKFQKIGFKKIISKL